MANALTTAQVAIAAASLMAAAAYTKVDASRQGYGSPLPADSYISSLDANGKVETFGFNADGSPKPATYRGATRDGKNQAGDPILDATGKQVNEATGIFIVDSHDQKLRVYDSVLRRLAASVKPEDKALWGSLTGNGAHGPIFTGALQLAVIVDVVGDRNVPRLIEAA